MRNRRAVVWGAGAWGTALALHLVETGFDVALWVYERAQYEQMAALHENPDFLPGFRIPGRISLFHDPSEVPSGAELWASVVPAQTVRALWEVIGGKCSPDSIVVSASKGIERGTLRLPSEVIESLLPSGCGAVVALSGPSFAHGLACGDPTAVVLACSEEGRARAAQGLVSARNLRCYAGADRLGAELGGAVKNVIALATGIAAGLGFGSNTQAALITRGLREIARLGVALGAQASTFSGLSGLGDLVLTCTGGESRNRTVGFRLGRGERLDPILASMKMVAEGVPTTRSVADLARREGIEMPITRAVERILFEDLPPRAALEELLARHLKPEMA